MPENEEELLSVEDLLGTGRMRQELEIARRIQRGFLPKAPPDLQGFEIDGWNAPCDETAGDYYDYLRLPGGRLALAIGDVSSHGIGPALLMAGARSALRALLQAGGMPGQVLARLNDVLIADMPEDHFMTLFVGVLDLGTHELRYAVAGHERPLLLRRGSEDFLRLDARGMPIGARQGLRYTEGKPVRLRGGDLLVCFTDGIWQATNRRDEEFGHDRLEAVLRSHRARPAADVAAVVRDAIASFTDGARQLDDLTLMVLKAA